MNSHQLSKQSASRVAKIAMITRCITLLLGVFRGILDNALLARLGSPKLTAELEAYESEGVVGFQSLRKCPFFSAFLRA